MHTETNIQKARIEDWSEIEELLASCHLPSDDITEDHLEHFRLIKNAGRLQAVVGLELYGKYGLLRSLAVREQHRSKGWGKMLARHVESYAREQNLERLFLLTTTADQFFERLGYTRINRSNLPEQIRQSSQFKDICPSTAVVLNKIL